MHTEALPEGRLSAVIICCLQHDDLVTTFFFTCLSSPCDMVLALLGVCSTVINERHTPPRLGSQGWLCHYKVPSAVHPHFYQLRAAAGHIHCWWSKADWHCPCCRTAAQSLIRGRDGEMSLGWDMPAHRSAAVLCFDEMQVTDPFAAVALKGLPTMCIR